MILIGPSEITQMPNTDITITEIMYDAPNTVHDNNHEWVEVTNTGSSAVNMHGWTLDDSQTANSGVGLIPDTTLNPGDIAIFYNDNISEQEFIDLYHPAPGTVLIPVANWQPLNNTGGDAVQIFDDNANVVDSITYADDANPGESLNYTPDGTYEGAGTPDPGVVCFTAGSKIDTEQGPRPIETLAPGARIRTLDHGWQPLRWIGRRRLGAHEQRRHPALCPVEIAAGALGNNRPARPTKVSPQHRILLSGVKAQVLFGHPQILCSAAALVGQRGIRHCPPGQTVEYIHLLFDAHEIVFVDNLPSESFLPSAEGLANLSPLARRELFALFPQLQHTAMPPAFPTLSKVEAAVLAQ